MWCCDYAFYTNVYGGENIPAEAWPAMQRDAEAYILAITMGRTKHELPEDVRRQVCMAVCAVAEESYREVNKELVASETVGRWSRTYVAPESLGARRLGAARLYLADTGLLYRGV